MPSFTLWTTALIARVIVPVLSHPTHSLRHVHHQRYEHQALPTDSSNPPIKRAYDLDGNGIPDLCDALSSTEEACKEANNQWTTFNPKSPPTPTTKAVISVIQTDVSAASLPTGTLPSAAIFQQQNGTKWTLSSKGVLQYSGPLGQLNLQGDKARTGVLGNQVIWNFGDMTCAGGLDVCGFDIGPAMYGTSNISMVNTQDITQIQEAAFIQPHTSTTNFFANEVLGNSCTAWGMDNSNVAALNDTHGIVLSWEQWRNCPSLDGKNTGVQDRGLGASVITLGSKFPTATRVSGLLADSNHIAAGKLGIMAAEGYIYSYTVEDSGTSNAFATHNMIVGRARTSDPEIFSSPNSWEFYTPSSQSWSVGIPLRADAPSYNLQTASGTWNCVVYGTVMWSNYFNKYMLFCDLLENEFNFYTADRPEGPWSEEYQLITGMSGYYGSMVHPEYSENGSHKALYISMGPDTEFEIWRVEFDYDV